MIKKYKIPLLSIFFGLIQNEIFCENFFSKVGKAFIPDSVLKSTSEYDQNQLNDSMIKYNNLIVKDVLNQMGGKIDKPIGLTKIINHLKFPQALHDQLIFFLNTTQDKSKDMQVKAAAFESIKKIIEETMRDREFAFLSLNNLWTIYKKNLVNEDNKKQFIQDYIPLEMIKNKYSFNSEDSYNKKEYDFSMIKYFSKEQVEAIPESLFDDGRCADKKCLNYELAFEKYILENQYNKIPFLNFSQENQKYLTKKQLEIIYENSGLGLEVFHYRLDNKKLNREYSQYDFIAKLSAEQFKIWNELLKKDCELLYRYLFESKINSKKKYIVLNTMWTWREKPFYVKNEKIQDNKNSILDYKAWEKLPEGIQEDILFIMNAKFPNTKKNIFGEEYDIKKLKNNNPDDLIDYKVNSMQGVLKALLDESMGIDLKNLDDTAGIIEKFKFSKNIMDKINKIFNNANADARDFVGLEELINDALQERQDLLYANPETIIRGKKWKEYSKNEKKDLIEDILPKEVFVMALKNKGTRNKINKDIIKAFAPPSFFDKAKSFATNLFSNSVFAGPAKSAA